MFAFPLACSSPKICKPRDAATGRAGPSVGKEEVLDQLFDFTLESYFPHIAQDASLDLLQV